MVDINDKLKSDYINIQNNQDELYQTIVPGIILHKKVLEENLLQNIEKYEYTVELKKLATIDFIADFTGSIGAVIEGQAQMFTKTEIFPFETKIVAKLTLTGKWSLKQKFKVINKTTPKDIQMEYVRDAKAQLTSVIQQSFQVIGDVIPINDLTIEEIQNVIKEAGIVYADKEFPPTSNSIFSDDSDISKFQIVDQWRRPIEFLSGQMDDSVADIRVFYDKIEPRDIQEQQLGDGWFISALSTLAERPQLIERLFVNTDYNEQGVYRLRICKNGEWLYVTIDDFIPCAAMGGPLFCKNNELELWVMLLQKAYAKVHGNYFLLRGGFTHEALFDLTGCPTQYYNFHDVGVIKLFEQGALWEIIKNSYDQESIISFSMSGEERWSDASVINFDEEITDLLEGHSYCMIGYYEENDLKLINFRNPWENLGFIWNGDYQKPQNECSQFWTKDLLNKVNPQFDDGSFWMRFENAQMYFDAMNICQVRNWEETRIKGKFVKIQDIDNPNLMVVQSQYYYALNLKQKTRLVIGIHQEDERIRSVVQHRPYLDLGIAVLRKISNTELFLEDMKDYHFERQIQLDLTLEEGQYIILPRTTGCTLKNLEKSGKRINLINPKTKKLADVAKFTILDIFRKFDMKLDYSLEYEEFADFYQQLDLEITEEEWEEEILENFNSTDIGLTSLGFVDFWTKKILDEGEDVIYKWFYALGYDDELHSIRSRAFMLSIHSSNEINIIVKDALKTDIDERTNGMVVSKYGKEMDVKKGIRAFYSFSESIHGYSYIVINDQDQDVEVILDCSQSDQMQFSTQNPIVKKICSPHQITFMLHTAAIPSATHFLRSAKCSWTIIK